MKKYSKFLIFCLAGVLTGCYSIQARYSFDSETSFSDLKTYAWMPGVEEGFQIPSNAEHYKNVMNAQLASKGFELNSTNPDFLILTHPSKTYREVYLTAYGEVDFPKTSIGVEFLDADSRETIWEGVTKAFVSVQTDDSATQMKAISKGIEKLLMGFPPVAKN